MMNPLLPNPIEVADALSRSDRVSSHLHPHVTLSGSMLELRKLDARLDEDQYLRIDLSDHWLPPTNIYPHPQRLAGRPELMATVAVVVSRYFYRARASKSRHRRAGFMVAVLAKLFEYLWLNEIYDFKAITPTDFEDLTCPRL